MANHVTLPDAEPRRAIVHYHIMKCAGSTIAAILDREFGEDCYHIDRRNPRGAITTEDLAAFLLSTPNARAVTSHQARFPVPTGIRVEIIDCCPVRRPLDRLASLYNFVRKDPTQLLHRFTSGGIVPFFTALMNRYPDNVTNRQTALLGMEVHYHAPGPDDLALAIARLRASNFLVLVDRFDESMVVAEYALGPSFPGLQLHYRAENTTRPIESSLAERDAAFRRACGEALYARLAALGDLDEQLCDAASAELDRRIRYVPSFAERLQEFRRRCGVLAETA